MSGNDLAALCLPPTCFAPSKAGGLLPFFDRLYCYQPNEESPLPDHPLTQADLLQGYPPAPLGEELDNFRRLLKDMRAHANEYYQAYLSSLAEGTEEDVEAGWRQVARRLKGTVPAREASEAALWRARLFLALAESQAVLQEELAAGIQAIGQRENEMLRLLQGEDEDETSELPLSAAAPVTTFPIRRAKLLAAWGLLYLTDTRPDRPWLLATADEESADLLLDEYERAAGRNPEKLLTLAMPPAIGSKEEFVRNRQILSSAAPELLVRLGKLLGKAAFAENIPEQPEPSASELATDWQRLTRLLMIEHMKKPAAEPDASGPAAAGVLTFYRLPGISFPQLFRHFCRHQQEPAGSSSPNGILAVVRKS